MTTLKRYTCADAVLLCFCSAVHAQRAPNTSHLSDLMSVILPDSYVALAGEGAFSTYGAAISFPVYWVEDRVKVVPLFGLMWQNFVDEGFNVRPAAGAKVLYYFQKKRFGLALVNSSMLVSVAWARSINCLAHQRPAIQGAVFLRGIILRLVKHCG